MNYLLVQSSQIDWNWLSVTWLIAIEAGSMRAKIRWLWIVDLLAWQTLLATNYGINGLQVMTTKTKTLERSWQGAWIGHAHESDMYMTSIGYDIDSERHDMELRIGLCV